MYVARVKRGAIQTRKIITLKTNDAECKLLMTYSALVSYCNLNFAIRFINWYLWMVALPQQHLLKDWINEWGLAKDGKIQYRTSKMSTFHVPPELCWSPLSQNICASIFQWLTFMHFVASWICRPQSSQSPRGTLLNCCCFSERESGQTNHFFDVRSMFNHYTLIDTEWAENVLKCK